MCCHILNGAHTIRLYSWALNVTKLLILYSLYSMD